MKNMVKSRYAADCFPSDDSRFITPTKNNHPWMIPEVILCAFSIVFYLPGLNEGGIDKDVLQPCLVPGFHVG